MPPPPPQPPTWTGKLSIEDTHLATTDHGGPGTPTIYLNGQFTTQFHWNKVIAHLGPTSYRHITFDERARGKSSPSADYTFAAALRDVDAVLLGRGIPPTTRVIVVGWSYGAYVAVHWASRNPERCVGAVLVDGAYPFDWLDEAMEERIRTLFRRLNWFMPLLRPTVLAPRMSAREQAESNIEVGVLSREGELGPILDGVVVPVRYVVASGSSGGSKEGEMERCRGSVEGVVRRNGNVAVSAKVGSGHSSVLRKDSLAVAEAIREVAAIGLGKC